MLLTLLTALATSDGTPEECNGLDDDANGLVDDGAVCTGCRVEGFEGRAYLFCEDEQAGREAASSMCEGFGYHLVDVEEEAEHDWLVAQMSLIETYWTGLTDSEPNQYRWSDGSDASYIPWTPGQPDDLTGSEDCAWYVAVSGASEHGFNDVPCTAEGAGAVCESAPSPHDPCDTGVVDDTGRDDTGVAPGTAPVGHVICGTAPGTTGWFGGLALLLARRSAERQSR